MKSSPFRYNEFTEPPTSNRQGHEISLNPPNISPLNLIDNSQKRSRLTMRDTWIRWVILAMASTINFALNYSSNNPQAFQPSVESFFDIGDAKFNLLYSVYSVPNIILPLIGGYLTDRLGVRFSINIFGSLIIIGQSMFTYGAYKEDFNLMVFGRFIFGLGGESLTVSQLPLLAKWFKGGELAFAYGFSKSAVRLGKSANSFFTPKIYIWTGVLYAPLLVGLAISAISGVCGAVFCHLDKKADQEENQGEKVGNKRKVSLGDLQNFTFIFYLLLGSYAFLFGAFNGVSNNLNNVLVTRFGFDTNYAGNLVMAYYLLSAIAGPLVGYFIEIYGRKTQLMLIMTSILFFTNLLFAILKDGTPENPNYQVIIPLIGIIIFSSFYTILFWACMAEVTDKKIIGTGTGMITCMSNLTQSIIPLVLGLIHDRTVEFHAGYFWTEIALCVIVGIGLILDYWIHVEDQRTGGQLALTGEKKNHK